MTEEERIFNELKEKYPIDDMIKFDETDIQEKLQNNTFNIIHYKELYYKELDIYEELERKMEALTGQRYKYYRFNHDEEWSKPEIEKYCLPIDKKIIRMKKILKKQKVRVRFFELCYKAFEQQGWRMKTYTDRDRHGI
jgi:hypothetical protein